MKKNESRAIITFIQVGFHINNLNINCLVICDSLKIGIGIEKEQIIVY